jgi:2-methylcitrate dehydratase PrpD
MPQSDDPAKPSATSATAPNPHSSDAVARLAHRLAAIDAADVAPELAARRLGDTVAALLAGRQTDDGRRAARIAGERVATPRHPAAFAATIRHTEIDDIHLATCVTASAVVIPAALAVAASTAIDGPALRRGLAAGYGAAIRFGAAVGGARVLREGIWPTLAVAPVTAAAVAGVMLGLDAEALANALRIASLRSFSRIGRTAELSARWYLFGAAVASGIEAAAAAAAGLRIDDVVPLPNALDAELADRPLGDGEIGTLSQKPICTSRQALSGVFAFLALMEQERFEPARVAHVRVEVPRDYAWMIEGAVRSGERLSTATSQSFLIAAAALDRPVLYDVARNGPYTDALIRFAQRVEVAATDAFDDRYPHVWPARVTIRLDDGRERSWTLEHPPGDPERPLAFADLQAKSPAYTAAMHELCRRAVDEGPSALLAALDAS